MFHLYKTLEGIIINLQLQKNVAYLKLKVACIILTVEMVLQLHTNANAIQSHNMYSVSSIYNIRTLPFKGLRVVGGRGL